LSSITDRARRTAGRRHEDGQVLVIFAGGLIALIAIAALVFDTGQSLLDRRTEQNAADAAALAGARYLPSTSGRYQGDCSALTPAQKADPQLRAVTAACEVAAAYLDAEGFTNRTITVKRPPGPESGFSGLSGNIEVRIDSTRPSFFAGVLGMTSQHTGALGTAANTSGYSLPYSLLSLDPSGCNTSKITGSGIVQVSGSIHIDSTCDPGLLINGNGGGSAASCDAVGGVNDQQGNFDCPEPTGIQVSGDPLRNLATPPEPTTLGRVVKVSGTKNVPGSCPVAGSVFATFKANPQPCQFNNGNAGGTIYRLYPGYYPGGLKVSDGTLYLEPGIYWIGGGGIQQNGGTIIAVDTGGTTAATADGGVLIYNSEDSAFHSQCAANPTYNAGCFGGLSFAGTGSVLSLRGIQTTIWKNIVLFQDRANSQAMTVNGNGATISITGTIYAPKAVVTINGDGGDAASAQVIAYDFIVNGNAGTFVVTYQGDALFQLAGVGLVE
jgi:hypothetical protein